MKQLIHKELIESAQVNKAVIKNLIPQINAAAQLIINAFRKGKKLILFGNGGSAADAQHIACELIVKFGKERRPLPAITLTNNTSNLTAIGNDYGFEATFALQMEALANNGDVALGISTSGKSPNILKAFKVAKKFGLKLIAICGNGGGKLKDLTDLCLIIPSNSTPRIQESCITIGHIICKVIEENLFRNE